MAKYEVFIPAAMASEFNVTLKVDADNWMAALKSGLTRLGEKGTQVTNIMVDIMEDNSIHVSDMASGRVFRIKELEEMAAPVAAAPIPLSSPAPIPLSAPAPTPVAAEARTLQDLPAVEAPAAAPVPPAPRQTEAPAPKPVAAPSPRPVAPPAAPKPVAPAAPTPAPKPVEARPAPKPAEAKPAARAAASEPARPRPSGEAQKVEQVASPSAPISGPIGRSRTQVQLEEIFSDLFERTQDVYGMSAEKALAFLLDLAMEKIPSDAGSVFVSDLASNDLQLLAARGPKAKELEKMKLRVPMGVGIVGFCAQETVSLAISDTERDPRFYREVSEKIGYASRSILCAPMVSGGRSFGCLEIINKKGSSHFSDSELAILGYVAHQGARFLEQS